MNRGRCSKDVFYSLSFAVEELASEPNFARAPAAYPDVIHPPGFYGVELPHQGVGVGIPLNAGGSMSHILVNVPAGSPLHALVARRLVEALRRILVSVELENATGFGHATQGLDDFRDGGTAFVRLVDGQVEMLPFLERRVPWDIPAKDGNSESNATTLGLS